MDARPSGGGSWKPLTMEAPGWGKVHGSGLPGGPPRGNGNTGYETLGGRLLGAACHGHPRLGEGPWKRVPGGPPRGNGWFCADVTSPALWGCGLVTSFVVRGFLLLLGSAS